MKMAKTKEFKFTLRKGGNGKIVKFNLEQLEDYSNRAQWDFVAILIHHLKIANDCVIHLDHDIHMKMLEVPVPQSYKTIIGLHLSRAVIDYCMNPTVHILGEQACTILKLLEVTGKTIDEKQL